jgi:hypothetical protein
VDRSLAATSMKPIPLGAAMSGGSVRGGSVR